MAKKGGKGKKGGKKGKKGDKSATPVTPSISAHRADALTSEMKEKVGGLDKELQHFRNQVELAKQDNDKLRQEIAASQRESADYLLYLEKKNQEKQQLLQNLQQMSVDEQQQFHARKQQAQTDHVQNVQARKNQILQLEIKLEQKKQEIESYTDAVTKRNKYEGEITQIKKEIEQLQRQHHDHMAAIELKLFEQRVHYFRESERKLKATQEAANEHAAQFLQNHIERLESENERLKREFAEAIRVTESYKHIQEQLQREHKELEREWQIRDQIHQVRKDRIEKAVLWQEKRYLQGLKDDEYS